MIPKFHFAVPVWGDAYVKTYLSFSLPTQLASGNIPALDNKQTTYTIYTTKHDCEIIQLSRSFHSLNALVNVDFIFIDNDLEMTSLAGSGGKYHLKSKCYRDALRRASKQGSVLATS